MNTRRLPSIPLLLTVVLGALNLAGGRSAASVAAQDTLTQAESLIHEAREQGIAYLNSNDKKAKKRSKDNLKRAEKLLKKELKRDASCQPCTEKLVETYFYKAFFKFSKNYNDCIKTAAKGLDRFPESSRIAYFEGYAYYNAGEFGEAARALTYYLDFAIDEPEKEAHARNLLADSQEHFLESWYNQADFYQSPESRIETFNSQTFKQQVVFQATREWELKLGAQGFNQLTSEAPKSNDPEVDTYVADLVNRLVGKTPGPGFDYRVAVVSSPEINAVTTPGHIIVNTGLLGFAETESQLVGVLSHELAHNYAHHRARAVIKQYQARGVATAITQMFSPKGRAESISQIASLVGVDLFLRAYSRFEEKEADLYGSHIMFNAGYNPTSATSFFLNLYKRHPKQPVKFLSTHPPTPDRVNYLTDYLESFPLDREMKLDSEAFQDIRARLTTSGQDQPAGQGRKVLPPSP